jgi:hypothetical protein
MLQSIQVRPRVHSRRHLLDWVEVAMFGSIGTPMLIAIFLLALFLFGPRSPRDPFSN